MADLRMRALQRGGDAGDVSATARWLHERLRTGSLTRRRCELAAYLGHAPSARVTGVRDPSPTRDARTFAQGLEPWGADALVRAAVAAARSVAELWTDAFGVWTAPADALSAALRWVECPHSAHDASVRRDALQAYHALYDVLGARPDPRTPPQRHHAANLRTYRQAVAGLLPSGAQAPAGPFESACATGLAVFAAYRADCSDRAAARDVTRAAVEAVVLAARAGGAGRTRAAITDALLPWTLDPPLPTCDCDPCRIVRAFADDPGFARAQVHAGASYSEAARTAERVFSLPARRERLTALRQDGTLSVEALELAAYLGDSAARAVLGDAAPDTPPELSAWIEGLSRWDTRAPVEAAAAATCCAPPDWLRGGPAALEAALVRDDDLAALRALAGPESFLVRAAEGEVGAAGHAARRAAERAGDEGTIRRAVARALSPVDA